MSHCLSSSWWKVTGHWGVGSDLESQHRPGTSYELFKWGKTKILHMESENRYQKTFFTQSLIRIPRIDTMAVKCTGIVSVSVWVQVAEIMSTSWLVILKITHISGRRSNMISQGIVDIAPGNHCCGNYPGIFPSCKVTATNLKIWYT